MIFIFYYILLFILGLFVGSFLNVIADRSIVDETFIKGRSRCDNCKKTLSAKDLIPVFSYLFLQGKCRYCKIKLSIWYPLAEIMTGILFTGSAYISQVFTDFSIHSLFLFIFLITVSSFYMILFLSDAKYKLIPSNVIYTSIIAVFIFLIIIQGYTLFSTYRSLKIDEFGQYLIKAGYFNAQLIESAKYFGILLASSLGLGAFFWFLVWITRGKGMGDGDITLAVLIGLVNGFPNNILAIFLGFLFGAVFSLPLVLFKTKGLKDTIAFGPFLLIGSAVAFIWGSRILDWYLQYL